MNRLIISLLSSFVLIYLPVSQASDSIIGWLENTTLYLNNQALVIEAKIDSGADHSSLHAKHIEYFEKNTHPWVKFETLNQVKTELPLYRKTNIKTKRIGYQQRPVVLITLCLAGKTRQVQMNLVDRAHFSKSLLIGRSALQGFLIHPNTTHLADKNSCKNPDKENFKLGLNQLQ